MEQYSFTIVLVTNRPEKIRRWCDYHAGLTFIIVDGSPAGLGTAELSNYFHLPGSGYFERLKYGLEKVKTNYVMVGGDDEFVSVVDVRNTGSCSKCREGPVLVVPNTLQYVGPIFGFWRGMYDRPSDRVQLLLASDDIQKRLSNEVVDWLFSSQFVVWYSLVKIELLQALLSSTFNDNDFLVFESSLLIHSIASGPVKLDDKLLVKRVKNEKLQWEKGKLTNYLSCINKLKVNGIEKELIMLHCLRTSLILESKTSWFRELKNRILTRAVSVSKRIAPYHFI